MLTLKKPELILLLYLQVSYIANESFLLASMHLIDINNKVPQGSMKNSFMSGFDVEEGQLRSGLYVLQSVVLMNLGIHSCCLRDKELRVPPLLPCSQTTRPEA
jgi:hypothetical protein